MDSQQLFLHLVAEFICTLPATAGRCDAAAALRLAAVAKNPQRYRLSAWGWRAMRQAEVEQLRIMHLHQGHMDAFLGHVGTFIRSNTDAVAGSLMSRVRHVVSGCAILEALIINSESHVTSHLVRNWVRNEVLNGLRWWGPNHLATDQAA